MAGHVPVVVVLWLLGLEPGQATAAVAVAPTASVGEEPSAAEPAQLDHAVLEGLRRGELSLSVLEGPCPDRACWIERARERGFGHLLLPQTERRGPDQMVRIDVVAVTTGDVIASVDGVCEICGEDEVVSTTADMAAELLPRLARLGAERAEVVIEGSPPGATIEVDGSVVGQVPWHGELPPGEHVVRILDERFLPLRRTVVATVGVRERIEVELVPRPVEHGDEEARPSRALLGLGGGLMGLGVVGVATGAGLFALDGRPYRDTCPPDAVDVNGRCPQVLESTVPAAVTVAVAGAALVAGAVLVVHAVRRKRRKRPAADVALGTFGRGPWVGLRF